MRLPIALSALIFCVSCGDSVAERIAADARARVNAEPIAPVSPPRECSIERRADVGAGDRLDVAVLALARVQARHNADKRACGAWISEYLDGLSGPQ
ncbi:hypothetical protein JI664_22660 [Rhodobacter sp. NTK016B]|uniref:hypothetical protein n=1 Tax=Rhodobacter sp. NTK016B TaxID=2759676 RepID=UPI001A8C37BD|nr:hypothetical protein [Rhodobacter sp. NTK016B]MBN8294790.1 hypothetical protein [Rhodobacter sp. NTK016B]